jgi:hypothetical protein
MSDTENPERETEAQRAHREEIENILVDFQEALYQFSGDESLARKPLTERQTKLFKLAKEKWGWQAPYIKFEDDPYIDDIDVSEKGAYVHAWVWVDDPDAEHDPDAE